jgi:hypothetical protein
MQRKAKGAKHAAKKAMLKKIVKGKKGASPFPLDNSLGKTPLAETTIGSGGGSNLGTNGIF